MNCDATSEIIPNRKTKLKWANGFDDWRESEESDWKGDEDVVKKTKRGKLKY